MTFKIDCFLVQELNLILVKGNSKDIIGATVRRYSHLQLPLSIPHSICFISLHQVVNDTTSPLHLLSLWSKFIALTFKDSLPSHDALSLSPSLHLYLFHFHLNPFDPFMSFISDQHKEVKRFVRERGEQSIQLLATKEVSNHSYKRSNQSIELDIQTIANYNRAFILILQ